MPDILQGRHIRVPIAHVFDLVPSPHALKQRWTETCKWQCAVRYSQLLRRYMEHGETVVSAERLDV